MLGLVCCPRCQREVQKDRRGQIPFHIRPVHVPGVGRMWEVCK